MEVEVEGKGEGGGASQTARERLAAYWRMKGN